MGFKSLQARPQDICTNEPAQFHFPHSGHFLEFENNISLVFSAFRTSFSCIIVGCTTSNTFCRYSTALAEDESKKSNMDLLSVFSVSLWTLRCVKNEQVSSCVCDGGRARLWPQPVHTCVCSRGATKGRLSAAGHTRGRTLRLWTDAREFSASKTTNGRWTDAACVCVGVNTVRAVTRQVLFLAVDQTTQRK